MKAMLNTSELPAPGQERDDIAAYLASELQRGASAAQITEIVRTACRGIDAALSPIVGQRGVAALYKRSVHLASLRHAWLAGAPEGVPSVMEVETLTSVLTRRTPADAAAAGALVLRTFHELLTTLVGPSLTERLLRSVWATFLSGPSAPETTP